MLGIGFDYFIGKWIDRFHSISFQIPSKLQNKISVSILFFNSIKDTYVDCMKEALNAKNSYSIIRNPPEKAKVDWVAMV
ncbi:hypothetical protein NC99_34000 [Sunxiuqinia dokdonensis]|uniref:Uncharacterized protein n=1 Tax=Sunxiuqinia dokdonensis TaxID=1409788 RepID=A0A0L8V605_9BACT|nr:hypothetical protein NC99_34000 [Sunxiuqinia dokdonensis]